MKTLLMFTFGCIISFFCTAQVQLMDLNVMPLQSGSNTDSVLVLIQLKISNPANAQNIHFQFGSQHDNGDVINESASVILQGADYYTSFNGRQEIIQNHDTRIYCKMSMSQYNTWQHLTVYAAIPGGGSSNHLYQTR
ncbi:MAG: hypothetical protein HY951_03345 [Bacteroidia bacterium]|nr:hypothetical protein [Bacteroidia bacterium]